MQEFNRYRCMLVKEDCLNYNPISCTEDVADILERMNFSEFAEEHVVMFSLNTKGHINGLHMISQGSVNGAEVHPREVYKRALLNNASCIILAHNHPSGDTQPSSEDISTTERIREAGELLGVKLIDHIIVGNGYLSMCREGYL